MYRVILFFEFLKEHKDILEKLDIHDLSLETVETKLIPIAKEHGFDITAKDIFRFLNAYSTKNNIPLNEEILDKVAGGKGNFNRIIAASFIALTGFTGISNSKNIAYATNTTQVVSKHNVNENKGAVSIHEKIIKYLKNEKVPEIEEKILNDFINNKRKINLLKISSDRYNGEKPTDVENELDLAVDNGDLPIEKFTLDEINNCKANLKGEKAHDGEPEFVIVRGQNALRLYNFDKESGQDTSIVQIASQYNALESTSDEPSSVKYWIDDHTQGPYASLQSVFAAKHRESAHLKGKLPDAIEPLLQNCKLDNDTTKQSILEKYDSLYNNGYLKLLEIGSIDDLKELRSFLSENIGSLGLLSQWVRCGTSDIKQLQVFTAAPSFQGYLTKSYWKESFDNNPKFKLVQQILREICETIVVNEYKALAQIAAIRSRETGKTVPLHLTMIGQEVFNNPPETIEKALKEVKKELKGTDVKVYLHGYNDTKLWENACKKVGINNPSIIDRTNN